MLTYNHHNNKFIWVGSDIDDDVKILRDAGFMQSTNKDVRARIGRGNLMFFTDSIYSVVAYILATDNEVDHNIIELMRDELEEFQSSNETRTDYMPPAPEGCHYLDYQRAGVDYALKRRHTLIGDAPGLGKAQPLDAKIRVPGGWKRMGDIKLGDGVCGYDGKGGRVIGVYPRGVMDIYEVTFSDGSTTRVSEDHLWRVQSRQGEPFVAPTWLITQKMTANHRLEIPMTAPVGGTKNLPVEPYLVGLLLGDGGLSQGTPRMSTADEEIVKYCRVQAHKFGVSFNHVSGVDYTFAGERPNPNRLTIALRKLGMMGKLAQHKTVPDLYMYAGPQQRLELLQGLMDSDGWVSADVTGFASSSHDLAQCVVELVQSLGGVARVTHKPNDFQGSWTVTINSPVCPFRLDRKAGMWRPHPKYKPKRFFRSIEYVGREPVQCIEVTCKDHLYLTDSYIVTHNTIQAIGFCNAIKAQRVLVICPASVRINWQREIFKWSTVVDRRAHKTWLIRSGDDGVSPLAHYNVISFDLMRNETIYKTACRMKWDVVIIDEAHYLKSPEAKRTINILGNSLVDGVVRGARHILALTGTPLPNRPREAYTLLRTLCWDAIDWMSHDSFVMTYNPSHKMPTGYVLEDSQRLLELQTRMRCNLMVRRHKEDVLPDLPDKMYELTYIDIETNSVAIKQVLKQERLLNFTLDQLMNPDPSILGQISTVRRMMGEAMVPGMVAYITMLLESGIDKLVVFAHHRTVIAALTEALTKFNPVVIQGDTSLKKRQQAIDSFQEDGNIKLFIGQLQAAGTGITLTAASDVVLCEASWVPGENEQAVDRCHRIGQKDSVLARYLVVEGSISEKIIGRALKKHHTTHAALDSLIME